MKQLKPGRELETLSSESSEGSPYSLLQNNTGLPHYELDDGGRNQGIAGPPSAAAAADTAEWQATIEDVVKSVVSIQFCQTHSFDTDSAISSEATGFVVDAERGYILTNRVWPTRVCLRRGSWIAKFA